MRRNLLIMLTIAVVIAGCHSNNNQDSRMKLWYDAPADEFIEALVMGNGQMGATVYGGVESEKISLNDITLWSG